MSLAFLQSHITEATIKEQVDRFYGRVREDRELGPVFESKIGHSAEQWAPHLQTMYAFWSSIFLESRRYTGNPLLKHRQLPPFEPSLFDRWLELFAATADEIFTPVLANAWKEKSERIAASLRIGLFGFGALTRKA